MPRYAYNKSSRGVKQKYFELIRSGVRGAEAARRVGVSMSCGSLWFIDAGSVHIIEQHPVSSRFLSQNDRIEIADGLTAGVPVKLIAKSIGKSFQTVYREIARNRKLDGTYQPWYAHNQAHVRRRRPKPRRLATDLQLRDLVTHKLQQRWSPEQTCRWLRRRYPRHQDWHLSWETVYDALYRGLLGAGRAADLRTGRKFRHRRGRGRNSFTRMPDMRSIHQRPRHIESRRQAGHWEGDRATWKVARGEWLHRFGGSIDEGVIRSSVKRAVPALACVMGDRGVRSPGKKPKPFSSHPGMVGKGKTGRVNVSESSYAS